MAVVEKVFAVEASIIGTKDYTQKVERSTAALYTPSLRQEVFILRYTGTLPTLPYPGVYLFVISMPQDDGTWGYEASSIVMHFMEMSFTIGSNNLVLIGLLRFASLADYYAWIIAENFPQMYAYGHTKLEFTLGVPTRLGSVYAIACGFWSANPTEIVSFVTNGLITDLTRQWMLTP